MVVYVSSFPDGMGRCSLHQSLICLVETRLFKPPSCSRNIARNNEQALPEQNYTGFDYMFCRPSILCLLVLCYAIFVTYIPFKKQACFTIIESVFTPVNTNMKLIFQSFKYKSTFHCHLCLYALAASTGDINHLCSSLSLDTCHIEKLFPITNVGTLYNFINSPHAMRRMAQ